MAIDKLKKIGEDGVVQDMVSKKISESKAREYLNNIKSLQPNESIKTIFEYLKNCGFDESWYAFEPTLARSFSYSTGPIWEVVIPELGGGSVLGGERFDNLVEKISGKKIPGTGFGLGFDRTLEAAMQLNLIPQLKTKTKVLVTIFSPDLYLKSLSLSSLLRDAGINTELYPDQNTKLDKQLKYANARGIPYVVVLGPEEISKNTIKLKDMMTTNQKELKIEELINLLS